jgi:photosystem II stability/assembly factor-like uncharacterized protein
MSRAWIRRVVVVTALGAALAGCARHAAKPQAWTPVTLPTDAEFSDVWFADTLNGWIVGGSYQVTGGLVGRTRDGGLTWAFTSGISTPEVGVSNMGISAIRWLGDHRGVIACSGGKIFLTDDDGANWRIVRYGRSAADHLSDLQFIDERNGWAVGGGGVYRTWDGGEHWSDIVRGSSENGYLGGNGIHFFDTSNGVLIGQFGSVMGTSDGGVTWTKVDVPMPAGVTPKPHLRDLCFADNRNGWIVGEEGTILHTADAGATWSLQETGLAGARSVAKPEIHRRGARVDTFDLGERTPGLQLTGVQFLDARQGWIVGNFGYEARSVVLKTIDGGATWTVDAEVRGEDLRGVFMLDADHGWAVGDRARTVPQVILRRWPAPKTS